MSGAQGRIGKVVADPRTQDQWGWKVALYLFFTGLGAGAYASGVVARALSVHEAVPRIATAIGGPAVAVGLGFLVWDLSRADRFWLPMRSVRKFWIGRGFVLVAAFLTLALGELALAVVPPAWPRSGAGLILVPEMVTGALALATAAQTGWLLMSYRPVALWTSPLIVLLFVASSVVTGGLAIVPGVALHNVVVAADASVPFGAVLVLIRLCLPLVLLQALLLALYVGVVARSGVIGAASARLLARGRLAPVFWVGVVGAGTVGPLVLGVLLLSGVEQHALSLGAAVLALAGGVLLRWEVLAAGVRSDLPFRRARVATG